MLAGYGWAYLDARRDLALLAASHTASRAALSLLLFGSSFPLFVSEGRKPNTNHHHQQFGPLALFRFVDRRPKLLVVASNVLVAEHLEVDMSCHCVMGLMRW